MKKTYDVLLLLGLKLNADGSATEDLKARVSLAAQLFRARRAPLIVACGGQTLGTPCTEAEVMAALLVAQGVPEECILQEDQSKTTVQNFVNALALLLERGFQARRPRALVVTSDYHVFRSRYIARKTGFIADGIGSATANDALKKKRRKLERMFFINFAMGWETGRHKRPACYDRVVGKIRNS